LVLPVEILGIWGLIIYRWKGLENTFPMVYYTSQKFNIVVAKWKRKICNRFDIVFYILMSGGLSPPALPLAPPLDPLTLCESQLHNKDLKGRKKEEKRREKKEK
jgi:hypothetical protein